MLRNFVLFVAGQKVARCPRVRPPVPERTFETLDIGGRSTPLEIPVGFELPTMEIMVAGVGTDALAGLWGLGADAPVHIILRGAAQNPAGVLQRVEIEVTGVVSKVDHGQFESRKQGETAYMVNQISHYKRTVGDRVTQDWDVANDVLVVDGVDVLAEQRSILGV